jgi:hypothetical protein
MSKVTFKSYLGDDQVIVNAEVTIIEPDTDSWSSDVDFYGTCEASIVSVTKNGATVNRKEIESDDVTRIEEEAIQELKEELEFYGAP